MIPLLWKTLVSKGFGDGGDSGATVARRWRDRGATVERQWSDSGATFVFSLLVFNLCSTSVQFLFSLPFGAEIQTAHTKKTCLRGQGESGWCSDVTSTHGSWRHAGV